MGIPAAAMRAARAALCLWLCAAPMAEASLRSDAAAYADTFAGHLATLSHRAAATDDLQVRFR